MRHPSAAPAFTSPWEMWTLLVSHLTSDSQCVNCRVHVFPLPSVCPFASSCAIIHSLMSPSLCLPSGLFVPRNENGSCLIKLVLISERLKPLQLAGEQRTWRRNYKNKKKEKKRVLVWIEMPFKHGTICNKSITEMCAAVDWSIVRRQRENNGWDGGGEVRVTSSFQ